jgi:5'-nucleotidase
MSYPIENKLVIAVASSALFDLSASDAVYRQHGVERYRAYQRESEDQVLDPGVAFQLVKRLLQLNDGADSPVEVVLLSRNDPDTGLRVMKSISFHDLPITRAAFVSGRNPFEYGEAFNAALCLSANPEDVRRAIESGIPAGQVLTSTKTDTFDDDTDRELRIAFDFDGVIVDDSSEAIYQRDGLAEFLENELRNADVPMPHGPLHRFFAEVGRLQAGERARKAADSDYKPRVRVAIVTARNAPAHERVVTTLRQLGVDVDETFFLGGIDKKRVLAVFRPHIFFDDQMGHVQSAASCVPCAHIPFGVTNTPSGEPVLVLGQPRTDSPDL